MPAFRINTIGVVRLALVAAASLAFGWPGSARAALLDIPVVGRNDDAEERVSNGNVSRNSSDLELVHDGNREQLVGLRFRNVALASGATINSAYLQFTVDETDSGATNVIVFGQAIGDAAGFSNANSDISNRTRTSASVPWNIAAWNNVDEDGSDQQTPDLTAIVSEIVAGGGWVSGNDMAFIIAADASTCTDSACQRTAAAFNGEPAAAPRLVIDYDLPGTADLALTQSDSPDPVTSGSNFAYTLTLTNGGPLPATGVTLSDTLSPAVTLQSVTPSQGACAPGPPLSCSLGDIAAGARAQVNIIVTADLAGLVSNTAAVSANELDPNPANDVSSETTTVTYNVAQLCYLVADAGGGNGGNDLLTVIDTADFNPATNETSIGAGTSTNNIEAIAWHAGTSVLYAANADRLGTVSLSSGAFTALPSPFGTGTDAGGSSVTFSDVDALAFDATTGVLYGVHARGGDDALIQIDIATGAFVPGAFLGADFVTVQSVFGNDITDDIAVDPTTGVMYATVNSGGNSDRLVRLDKGDGSARDIAQITVPDIEGLGTDPSGQLWGTSGTQGIVYEIDKSTGNGSYGRPLDNGSDYEAVDCYAVSPSVSADIAVSKAVDIATPLTSDIVIYTITATNTGSGPATSLQLSDPLPAGVTFVSAAASAGVYDGATGNWFVGALPNGSSATLDITATVDPGAGGSTITNTASIAFVSQNDPNSTNDTASADIFVAGIRLNKLVSTWADDISTDEPKSIPGATMLYRLEITNLTSVPTNPDTVSIVDELPQEVSLLVDAGGPVTFHDGAPASGLSYAFGGYASTTDDIDFSADTNFADGITWGYIPSTAAATDPNVTAIRIRPRGPLNGNSGGGDPNFALEYKTLIE